MVLQSALFVVSPTRSALARWFSLVERNGRYLHLGFLGMVSLFGGPQTCGHEES